VGTLNVGDVFGEMCLIDPGPRSATVKAVTATECMTISYEQFINSIQENPEAAVLFMKTIVRRPRQMNDRVASMVPAKRGLRDLYGEWLGHSGLSDVHWPVTW